jgi:Asp-tRNA(Asn)/Glu-tRNA(Gln) amidotransferase A subunit family amidase
MIDELPIGMMLVGRWFDERTLYRAAAAFEKATDQEQFGPVWCNKIKAGAKSGT